MKSGLFIGILFIVLGAAIAWTPQTVFPICGAGFGNNHSSSGAMSMGNSHMKCWYTGWWEIVTGSVISALGLLLIIIKKRAVRIILSIAAFLGGVAAILIPTILVGVCGNTHMSCRTAAFPALIILGGTVMLSAAINVFILRKRKNA